MTTLPDLGETVIARGQTGVVMATRQDATGAYVRLRRVDAPWLLYLGDPAPPTPVAGPAPSPASVPKPKTRRTAFPDAPTIKDIVP